jgi:hypothetical protein
MNARTATIATVVAAGATLTLAGPAGAATVDPVVVDGNPSCADVAPGSTEHKHDAGQPGVFDLGGVVVTIHDDGTVDWTSTDDVAAVIVKGGPVANVYAYPGAGDLADTGLVAATNPENEQPYGVSHVSVCVGPDVPDETTTTTVPEETTTTTVPEETTTTVVEPEPEPQPDPQPEPQPEPEVEVLGQQQEREALPRTGAGLTVLAAAGAALVAAGGAARRAAAARA